MIVVLAIAVILLGFVIARVGKMPVFVSFKKCVLSVNAVFEQAVNQAEVTGSKIIIEYNNRSFYPTTKNISNNDLFQEYLSYKIPEGVVVTFPDNEFEEIDSPKYFKFYPGGESAGPKILLTFHGHSATIQISPLTGLPIYKIID